MNQKQLEALVSKVEDEARALGLKAFCVAELEDGSGGASFCISNDNSSAVRHARSAHIKWEKDHGIDPSHSRRG